MIANPETLQEALFNALRVLGARRNYRDARLEAELLMAHACKVSRAQVLARLGDAMPTGLAAHFAGMVARRARDEPLAYILGHQEFYGLDFLVDRRVLIPRPETELLVERALELLEHGAWVQPRVVDVGTGSGAIAIPLALRVTRAEVIATDLSHEALELAQVNAQRLGAAARIEFREGDLLAPVQEPIDLLVANMPYIPATREADLAREIRRYEPRMALIAGLDGLSANRRLLAEAVGRVKRGSNILLEISEEQGREVLALARLQFPFSTIRLLQDLEGLDRLVEIQA